MSETNGGGLVAPLTTVYGLQAELEAARSALADSEARVRVLERDLAALRSDCEAALERAGEAALLHRVRLRAELRAVVRPAG